MIKRSNQPQRPVSRLALAAVWALIFGCRLTALAQVSEPKISEEYAVSRWGVENGLPEGVITSIEQFPDGFVWLTTPSHVVRFDGVEFAAFPQSGYPPGKPNRLNSITRDKSGTLWVSGEDGVMRHDGQSWSVVPFSGNFSLPKDLEWQETPDGEIRQSSRLLIFWVREGPDGTLWAASNAGMFRFQSGQFQFVAGNGGEANEQLYSSAAIEQHGKIWLAAENGLFGFDGQNYRQEPFPAEGARGTLLRVFAGFGDTLWGKRLDGKLFRRKDRDWLELPPPGLRQMALLESQPGEVWIGAAEGLYRWKKEHWEVAVGLPFESPQDVRCLAKGADGSVWVGTSAGLYQLRARLVRMVTPAPASGPGGAVTAILPKEPAELWVGTSNRCLFQGVPGKMKSLPEASRLGEGGVSALLTGRDGVLWVGIQGNHLWKLFLDGGIQMFRSVSEFNSRNVTCLLQDRRGVVWAGTREGLLVMKKNWLQSIDSPIGTILALCEDSLGRIWVGSQSSGLWLVLPDGKSRAFGTADGLPSNMIRQLHCDESGVLWIGTPAGLARWHVGGEDPKSGDSEPRSHSNPEQPLMHIPESLFCFTREHGLPSNDIRQLLDDGKGTLWIGTQREIYGIQKSEFEQVVEGRKSKLNFRVLGREDGLEADLATGDHGPLTTRLKDGTLWFVTQAGLACIDPARLFEEPPPPVFIEEVQTAGNTPLAINPMNRPAPVSAAALVKPAPWTMPNAKAAAPLHLPPGSRNLVFKFNSPSFSAPSRVRFRYLLEGYDAGWSPPVDDRHAIYPWLPPGKYRFRVMAYNASGPSKEDALSVVVEPFFWQTWWFRGIVAGLALSLAGAVGGLLVRRHAHRRLEAERLRAAERERGLEREKALEHERARIARDIHDDIGSSLTRILLQSKSARMESPAGCERLPARLSAIEATAINMTHVMDEIVWAVNPKNDTFDGLVTYLGRYAEDFLRLAEIRCRLDLPLDLPAFPVPANVRHGVFLAFKEALNNVTKHSHASLVRISVRIEPGGFELVVEDDGRGLPPDSTQPVDHSPEGDSARRGGGNGLKNVRNRLVEIGGTCIIDSQLGQGVRVVFRIMHKL